MVKLNTCIAYAGFAFFWVFCYLFLFYGINTRQNINVIFIIIVLLFTSYFYVLQQKNQPYKPVYLYFAIALRLLPIASLPILSDDFYRFIWDGQLLQNHINPFAYTPSNALTNLSLNSLSTVFAKLNSPNYYTVYPPVTQFVFWLAGFGLKVNLLLSVIILRCCLIAFDVGNIIMIKKLLAFKKLNPNLVLIYALNPLVIIEFAGNLHFEVLMIFFTLLAVYLLLKGRCNLSAISLGLAVCCKLIPILFLPLLIKQIGWFKTFKYGLIVAITSLILFIPFIYNTQLLANFINSLKLYYGTFEFNGSIYLVLKYFGWQYFDYNPIAYTSKILMMLSLVCFGFIYLKSKNVFEGIFYILFVYSAFAAIVHPWYILPLVAISPFVKWRFGVFWSGLIVLSYYTYKVIPYHENLVLVAIEYSLLYTFIVYEFFYHQKKQKSTVS